MAVVTAVAAVAVGSSELRGSGHARMELNLQQQVCNRQAMGTHVKQIGAPYRGGTSSQEQCRQPTHSMHKCMP